MNILEWRSSPELYVNGKDIVEVISTIETKIKNLEQEGENIFSSKSNSGGTHEQEMEMKATVESTKQEMASVWVAIDAIRSDIAGLIQNIGILNQRTSEDSNNSEGIGIEKFNDDNKTHSDAAIVENQDESSECSVDDNEAAQNKKPVCQQNIDLCYTRLQSQLADIMLLQKGDRETKEIIKRLQVEMKRRDELADSKNKHNDEKIRILINRLHESQVSKNELKLMHDNFLSLIRDTKQRLFQDVLKITDESDHRLHQDIQLLREEYAVTAFAMSTREELVNAMITKIDSFCEKVKSLDYNNVANLRVMESLKANIQSIETTIEERADEAAAISMRVDDIYSLDEKNNMNFEELRQIINSNESVKQFIKEDTQELFDEKFLQIEESIKNVIQTTPSFTINIEEEMEKYNDVIASLDKSIQENKSYFSHFREENKQSLIEVYKCLEETSKKNLLEVQKMDSRLLTIDKNLEYHAEDIGSINKKLHHFSAVHSLINKTIQEEKERTAQVLSDNMQNINQRFEVISQTQREQKDINGKSSRSRMEFKKRLDDTCNQLNSIKSNSEKIFLELEVITEDLAKNSAQIADNQNEIKAEIKTFMDKTNELLNKEALQNENMYVLFTEKQEKLARSIASSTVSSMSLTTLKKELDSVINQIIPDCWKFEMSDNNSQQSAESSGTDYSSNSSNRKLFTDRMQHLLVKKCRLAADLIVAKAECETLKSGANKDSDKQLELNEEMLRSQALIVYNFNEQLRMKIAQKKKNGEQYDHIVLGRRQTFISSFKNLLAAAIRRRTAVNSNPTVVLNGNQQTLNSVIETKSLLPSKQNTTKNLIRASTANSMTSSRSHPSLPNDQSAVAYTPIEENVRHIRSEKQNEYIFRGGFRLPRHESVCEEAVQITKQHQQKRFLKEHKFEISHDTNLNNEEPSSGVEKVDDTGHQNAVGQEESQIEGSNQINNVVTYDPVQEVIVDLNSGMNILGKWEKCSLPVILDKKNSDS